MLWDCFIVVRWPSVPGRQSFSSAPSAQSSLPSHSHCFGMHLCPSFAHRNCSDVQLRLSAKNSCQRSDRSLHAHLHSNAHHIGIDRHKKLDIRRTARRLRSSTGARHKSEEQYEEMPFRFNVFERRDGEKTAKTPPFHRKTTKQKWAARRRVAKTSFVHLLALFSVSQFSSLSALLESNGTSM